MDQEHTDGRKLSQRKQKLRDTRYVIPATKDKRIGPKCDRFEAKKEGDDVVNVEGERLDTPLYVEKEYTMYSSVKYEVTNERVTTSLVVLPPDDDDDVREDGSPQPFLTNFDVSHDRAKFRVRAREKMEAYSDRGAIENSYSSIKQAAAWTSPKEFKLRWFHFAFGCLVYNMWLLVDFLTQERIKAIETRKKPRITLSRFLRWLDKEVGTLI